MSSQAVVATILPLLNQVRHQTIEQFIPDVRPYASDVLVNNAGHFYVDPFTSLRDHYGQDGSIIRADYSNGNPQKLIVEGQYLSESLRRTEGINIRRYYENLDHLGNPAEHTICLYRIDAMSVDFPVPDQPVTYFRRLDIYNLQRHSDNKFINCYQKEVVLRFDGLDLYGRNRPLATPFEDAWDRSLLNSQNFRAYAAQYPLTIV